MVAGGIGVARLHWRPAYKIESVGRYLKTAIDKTAGDAEREAWDWLMEAVTAAKVVKRAST